jgi:hypothetical protein
MRRLMTVLFSLVIVCAPSARAEEDSATAGSNAANNPVEPRLTLQYWNYYGTSLNDIKGDTESGLGRSLIPFTIGGIQQDMHVDPIAVTNPTAKTGPRTGLGGLQLYNFTLLSFDIGLPDKMTIGFGPLAVAPIRTNRNFDTDKWQAGAAGLILSPQSWGLVALLTTYQSTVSGPSAHSSSTLPLVFYNLPHGYYLRSSAPITFNTASQTKVVPVGLGIGKVVNLDRGYTLNLYVEGQPSIYRTGVGAPNYQVYSGVSLQFPASFTRNWHIF